MIRLTDKYKLSADYYNFKVVKVGFNKKKNEPTEMTVAYVNDVAHAVRYLYGIETREYVMTLENDVELQSCIAEFNRIKDEVIEWGKQTIKEWNKVSKT